MTRLYTYEKPDEKAFFNTIVMSIQNKEIKTNLEEQILKKIEGGKCEIKPSKPKDLLEIKIKELNDQLYSLNQMSQNPPPNAKLYEDYKRFQEGTKILDTTIYFYVLNNPKLNERMKNKLITLCNQIMPVKSGLNVNKIESSILISKINEISHNKDLKGLIKYLNSDEFEIPSDKKYLNINNPPDDFYRDLITLINKCYLLEIYEPVQVFARKLLENLLIEILRKKYGYNKIDLYFNTKSGRFHGFSTLLKNLKDNMDDFKPYCAAINHGFLNLLKKFKVSGDSSAIH